MISGGKPLNRPSFSAVAMLLAASIASTAAGAETLIVSHQYAPSHSLAKDWIEPWISCVRKATNEGVTFDVFPSGQITSAHNALDAVNNGLTQISSIAIGYHSSKLPLNGISLLPNMGDTARQMVQAYRKTLDEGGPIAKEFIAANLKPLMIHMTPTYQLMSRVGPIETLEKFRGQKIRTLGGAMSLMASSIGASPVDMAAGDLYIALQQGTVDAALLAPLSVKPYKLNEVLNAISANGQFGSSSTVLAIDVKAWERLSPDFRTAFSDCGLAVEREVAQQTDVSNEALLAELASDKIKVYRLSDEAKAKIAERLAVVTENYIGRLTARGMPAQQAYDSYRAALVE
jgi:TRAP-type transport system periplasmic protein